MNRTESSERPTPARLVDMEINGQAPVVVSAAIEVAASPDVVWGVLTDFDAWPSWNPEVSEASLGGALAPGSGFQWKAGPGTIRSTIRELDPPRRIAWTGRSMGASAIHVWTLESSSGGTALRTEESVEGLIVRALRGRMQTTFQDAIDSAVRHLKG
jgi:uncharacterized protein YndB with AHSA1/START domain